MKIVLVLRHAKSSWKQAGLDDHDRPLKKRGRRDAPRMGSLLASLDLVPERILSSSAVRARSTAELAAEACGYRGEIQIEPEMYLSGEEAYLDRIRELPDSVTRVLVVGHNPDVENLVFALSGHNETMPTAALARIDLPVDSWGEVRSGTRGALLGVWRPRELAAD